MTITTKFDINDDVWFIHPRTQLAFQGKVCGIECRIGGREQYKANPNSKGLLPIGEYKMSMYAKMYIIDDKATKDRFSKPENELFPTKQELINSL